MLKSSVCGRMAKHLSLFFIFIITLSIVILSQVSSTSAVDSSATATVHVSEACSLTANVTEEHSDEMSNGTYTNSLGETKFTARCNDNAGFAIYAIGYSDDTYGATSMLGENGLSIPTGTDALNGNTTSHWSMKISKDTTSYQPANLTIENNFDSQHVIPSIYTKIASYSASTDGVNGTGSSIFATYGVRISGTQPANTYIGKVKYTLVHPNMVDDSNKPVYPLPASACPANAICYAPNASDIEGSMISDVANSTLASISSKYPTAAKQTYACPLSGSCSNISSSTTSITLIAPNYKRTGYGFAGWSTDFEADNSSTIYGPNETITIEAGSLSNNGMILYPVWIASTGNLQGWNGCSSLADIPTSGRATLASMTALTDTRDDNVYTVAKLADGKCWMTENLRLNNEATITTANTQSNNGSFGGVFTSLPQSVDLNWNSNTSNNLYTGLTPSTLPQLNTNNTNIGGKNASETDLISTPGYPIDSNTSGQNGSTFSWYSYGNYYSWPAAIADTTAHYSNNEHVSNTSICPTNWHLPEGGNKANKTNSEFWALGVSLTGDEPANTSSQTTPYYTGNPEGYNTSMAFRKFPNNFIYSGYWNLYGNSSSASNRGGGGCYWSSSAYNPGYAYNLFFLSSSVYPGTNNSNKYNGYAVRCVKSLPTIDDVESLQDFNSFSSQEMTSVLNSMTTGQTYHIPDNRDNESYTIAKLADGNVWMLDNLKLDLSNSSVKANLNSSTTNAPDNYLTSLASNVTDGSTDSFTSPQIITAYKNNTNGTAYGNGSGKVGIYYNFCATSAGTLCSDSSTASASYDICPAGWRLPTGGSGGEFHELCLAYDSSCSNGSSSLAISNTASVQYNLSRGAAGIATGNSILNANSTSVLWSSTFAKLDNYNRPLMYTMNLNNLNVVSYSNLVGGGGYGMSIRCIVNK